MSFFNSFHQFVSDAGQSINASARKLVSSISQDSNSGSLNEVMTPNIEVFSEDQEGQRGSRKRPVMGPLLIPNPELSASLPLSPGVHFSRRRPSLGLSPSSGGGGGRRNPFGKTLDNTTAAVG